MISEKWIAEYNITKLSPKYLENMGQRASLEPRVSLPKAIDYYGHNVILTWENGHLMATIRDGTSEILKMRRTFVRVHPTQTKYIGHDPSQNL